MEYKSADVLIKDLKEGQILPVYILHGTEAYFIDRVTTYIEHKLLNDGEKAFNQSVLYGRDVDVKQILDHARQFPMMSQYRVVIVKEAQGLRDLKSLDSYIQSPSPQTVFVLAHKKKIDGRIKWVKAAKKSDQVALMQSDSVPEYKMHAWITSFVKSKGLKISPEGVEILCQYLGNDLKKVSNEIEKVQVNLGDRKSIEIADIEKYIGISREYDVYALLRALSYGDVAKVQQITLNMEENVKSQPLQMVIPGMASYFEKTLIVMQNSRRDDRALGSMIGTYGSFVKEYRSLAQRYSFDRLVRAYSLLVTADGHSKGMEKRKPDGILKELVGKLLLLQR